MNNYIVISMANDGLDFAIIRVLMTKSRMQTERRIPIKQAEKLVEKLSNMEKVRLKKKTYRSIDLYDFTYSH